MGDQATEIDIVTRPPAVVMPVPDLSNKPGLRISTRSPDGYEITGRTMRELRAWGSRTNAPSQQRSNCRHKPQVTSLAE
jgi:hypothetical protein